MFKNRLERIKNMMQIMHITLIFYVQLPVAYISSLVLTFFNIFYVCFFNHFLGFFQAKCWGFSS